MFAEQLEPGAVIVLLSSIFKVKLLASTISHLWSLEPVVLCAILFQDIGVVVSKLLFVTAGFVMSFDNSIRLNVFSSLSSSLFESVAIFSL